MKAIQFIYNDRPVDFEPQGGNDVMVNATQMAKLFDRQTKNFIRLKRTEVFINACLAHPDSSRLGITSREDLILVRPCSGTWMHRILALEFANWLDPHFSVWLYCTLDEMLFNKG